MEKTLQPGESFTVPKRAVHLFKNLTDKKVTFEVELRQVMLVSRKRLK
jgi:quercetin dioxygenase-like cupin family protein